jgi:hypothetical protein
MANEMNEYSERFSSHMFKKLGVVKENSDLDFLFSEDIGNLNDLEPNEIYEDIYESYNLLEGNKAVFPLKYKFTEVEVAYQRQFSTNGNLRIEVAATNDSQQIWTVEISHPKLLNGNKSIKIIRYQEMLKPYSVEYMTELNEIEQSDFEQFALQILLQG